MSFQILTAGLAIETIVMKIVARRGRCVIGALMRSFDRDTFSHRHGPLTRMAIGSFRPHQLPCVGLFLLLGCCTFLFANTLLMIRAPTHFHKIAQRLVTKSTSKTLLVPCLIQSLDSMRSTFTTASTNFALKESIAIKTVRALFPFRNCPLFQCVFTSSASKTTTMIG